MNGIVAILMGEEVELPDAASKAFNHWSNISKQLHELFDRAPGEAIVDSEARLARMALKELENGDYSPEADAMIKEEANAVITSCSARNRERAEAALAESRAVLGRLDKFVASLDKPIEQLSLWEAEIRVRQFLDDCRKFDQELSAIPVRLTQRSVPVSIA